MREEARIQIRGDKAALQNAWNSRFDPKIEYGLVVLYKDDAACSQLRRLFDSLLREHVMTWHERVHAEYSQQELESFELLRWIITGRAGPGNNTYGPVYVVKDVCPECGRVSYGQARDLILDLALEEQDSQELGYFRHDVCRTDAKESEFYLVSESVPDASVMRTREEFGRGPAYTSEVIIRQEVYRVLRSGEATGFWVEVTSAPSKRRTLT